MNRATTPSYSVEDTEWLVLASGVLCYDLDGLALTSIAGAHVEMKALALDHCDTIVNLAMVRARV